MTHNMNTLARTTARVTARTTLRLATWCLTVAATLLATTTSAAAEPSAFISAAGTAVYGQLVIEPPITRPLDVRPYLKTPCRILTRDQAAAFGITEAGTPIVTGGVADYAGPLCAWHANPELGSTLGVGFITGNKNGLADLYRGRDRFEDFRPTTVDGYPAVFANSPDLRSGGTCDMAVGVHPDLMIRVGEQGRLDPKGCDRRIVQGARAVLATLKGGA